MILNILLLQFSSVVSYFLRPHGLLHTRLPSPSPTPEVCSNSCPSSWWCHPTVSSSVIPFSCLQSLSASGFFPMSRLFASGGQSTGASASVLPINIKGWFLLGLTVGNNTFSPYYSLILAVITFGCPCSRKGKFRRRIRRCAQPNT